MRRLAPAALAALALGGCTTGSVDDVDQGQAGVELAVDGYLGALADENPARACSKLTSSYRKSIAQSDPRYRQLGITDCEELLGKIAPKPFRFEGRRVEVGSIDSLLWTLSVDGDFATLRSESRRTTFKLQKSGRDWKIDSIVPVQG